MAKISIKNANIYNTAQKKFIIGSMEADNGIITRISEDCGNSDSIDMLGARIIPGMIDVHTHGRAGFDFDHASPDEVIRMCASYASIGTTAVFATIATSPFENMKQAIVNIGNAAKNMNGRGASVDGIHIEGRFLNIKRRGAHNPDLLAPLSILELTAMLDLINPLKSHITVAAELEGGEEFVKTAVKNGTTVGLGHTDSSYDEALRAMEWGVTSFTHTFNAMKPLHHREPGTVGAALTTDGYAEIISDGFHLHPSIVKLAYLAKNSDRLVLITDSMEATGFGDGEYGIAGTKVYVKDGLCRSEDGTISGSTLNLYKGVRNFMNFCGITLEEAVPYATINPARMVGIDDRAGSLEAGKRADFLVLDNNSDIERVYINGSLFE